MENNAELKEIMDRAENNSLEDIKALICRYSFRGIEGMDHLKWVRKLYYLNQNEYDKLDILGISEITKHNLRLRINSDGEAKDLEFIRHFIDEADKGDQFYCILAAEVFIYDLDISTNFKSVNIRKMYDRDKALAYLEKAAGLGSGVACNMLGDMLSGWSIELEDAEDRELCLQELIFIKKGTLKVTTSDGKDDTENYFWTTFIDNDKFKADFELAKKYYALGAELGNDICKDRLKDYDKRIKKTQRLIARSILEDPKTGKLMEDEDIEALLDWFRDKFKAK